MIRSWKTPAALGLAALLLAGVVCLQRTPSDPAAVGPLGGADPLAQRGQELDDRIRRALRRFAARRRLAGEVIDGRLTLPEAAAGFRDVSEADPAFDWERFRLVHPGASDDERLCRQVIGYVWVQVQNRPDADPALPGRLEAELEDLLRRGDLRLPPWADADGNDPGGKLVELLEQTGTPEARQVLEEVAKGQPGGRPARDARAALERLGRPAPSRRGRTG